MPRNVARQDDYEIQTDFSGRLSMAMQLFIQWLSGSYLNLIIQPTFAIAVYQDYSLERIDSDKTSGYTDAQDDSSIIPGKGSDGNITIIHDEMGKRRNRVGKITKQLGRISYFFGRNSDEPLAKTLFSVAES